jgi:hypothetical protein
MAAPKTSRHLRAALRFIFLLTVAGFLACGADAAAVEQRVIERVAVSDEIEAFIAAHPQATLAEVAAFANDTVARVGLLYQFDYRSEGRIDSFRLRGDEAEFVVVMHDDPEAEPSGPCGEQWAPLPVAKVERDVLHIVQGGRQWVVKRPKELKLDHVKILSADQTATLAVVEIPWQTIPSGVTPDGRAVLVEDPLYDAPAAWWAHIKASYPEIWGDTPFLLLAVSREGFSYVGDPELYRSRRSKLIKDWRAPNDAYARRVEFADPHVVVEYIAPCT